MTILTLNSGIGISKRESEKGKNLSQIFNFKKSKNLTSGRQNKKLKFIRRKLKRRKK